MIFGRRHYFHCIKAFSACNLLLLCKNNHFHHV
nr:MAG TPA: hypothetical protein [Caudoviricetes sp.]